MDGNVILYSMKVSVIGFLVVFLALIIVALMIRVLASVDFQEEKKPKPHSENKLMPMSNREEISPEIIAIISAAVTVAIDKKYKVRRIRLHKRGRGQSWSMQGQMSVMGSRME
ncbi:MAG: hypothetical protein B6244_10265 [Candidatus Cloacimonetes bacterium 4572_55]|nr:MAG: hypothetical protein B6244_10265 [Candidatus Cloacimonetes bacterium 4572_55]